MRKTNASNAKNQDISHTTALTSDVMNVMNTDTLSWTALTEYLLQEHWHHTTRHTEITTPQWASGTTRKIKKVETDPDDSLDTANTVALPIMTCIEAAPDHNKGIGTAAIEAAQDNPIQHTGDTVTGHAMTHTLVTLKIFHTLQLIRLLLSGSQ